MRSMNNVSPRDVWAFNPAQMSEGDLMSTLVGRDELIEDICRWLRANRRRLPDRHRLFFGPRGMGKTTLLLAAYYTVCANHDLRESFSRFGEVVSATLVTDRDTGRSRGFGFVEMSTEAEAQSAMQGLNGHELDGRALKVNEAKPRRDDDRRY